MFLAHRFLFPVFLAALPGPALAADPAPTVEIADPYMRQALSLQSVALSLRNGEYLWRDDMPNAGAVTIIVSIPLQRMYVFRDLQLIGVSTISSGKPGKRTPLGAFEILQKRQYHRSNLYSNAPMPFMQRLTWTGIALHGGQLPGYPASHGCIRLPMAFARLLFGATAIGGQVAVVSDDVIAPPPPEERYVPRLVVLPDSLRAREFDRVFARGRFADAPPQPARANLWVDDRSVPEATLILPYSLD